MFFKKNKEERYTNPLPNPYMNQNQGVPGYMYNYQEVAPNNYDLNRLQTEIDELKRINNEMLKRVSRIETYLGIRGNDSNSY